VTRADILRHLALEATSAKYAMEEFQGRVKAMADHRRKLIVSMIDIAKADGSKSPQRDVANMLGITQQAVSKIINGGS